MASARRDRLENHVIPVTKRQFLRAAGLFAVAGLLGGCGFRPLYGPPGSKSAALELADISIRGVSDRLDQILRNELIQRLTPFGEPAQPRFDLFIKSAKASSALAIQSNSTITRYNLVINASFVLMERDSDQPIFRGSAGAVGSYDAVRSDFATLTAEQDSARRTVGEVAEEIRAQLGAFFSRRLAQGG